MGVGLIQREVPAGGESVISMGLLAITGNDSVGSIGLRGCDAFEAESVGDLVFGEVLCCAIAIPTGIVADDGLREMRDFFGNCLVAVLAPFGVNLWIFAAN